MYPDYNTDQIHLLLFNESKKCTFAYICARREYKSKTPLDRFLAIWTRSIQTVKIENRFVTILRNLAFQILGLKKENRRTSKTLLLLIASLSSLVRWRFMANEDLASWTDLLHSSSKLLEQAAPSAQFPPLQVSQSHTFFSLFSFHPNHYNSIHF
jgi:hypothetical protein